MADPTTPSGNAQPPQPPQPPLLQRVSQPQNLHFRQGILPPGTVVPSAQHPGGRSIILDEQPDLANRVLTGERVTRDWEYVTVARPVDMHEKVYEVPTKRSVQTIVPRVQVREVVKTIKKDTPEYVEREVEIPHQKIIDKYVEVPVVSGTEVKYVPKIEVRERTVKVTKPEIKWVEKIIEVPQIKEVVRYIESEKNVEQVIRYVPQGQEPFTAEQTERLEKAEATEAGQDVRIYGMQQTHMEPGVFQGGVTGATSGIHTPRSTVPLSQRGDEGSRASFMPQSPRLDRMEQLFIPRITRTVEVEKEIPVTVDVPVPYMVPRPVQVPVEVPVLRFRDHFVPVPVRRHVIPRLLFSEEVYEVDCAKEKPVLVVEDYFKPVPVDVKIKLKEKDIKVIPIDPAELSQADFHAMWMRVNADLLERVRAQGREVELFQHEEGEEEVKDPTLPEFGPLPLHPGHPLMMTYLQAQWIQNASTVTHNMYTPEFFRMHASALDSLLNPQPHQVNITQEQSAQLGPLPAEQMPSPWGDVDTEAAQERIRQKLLRAAQEPPPVEGMEMEGMEGEVYPGESYLAQDLGDDGYVRSAYCAPCCVPPLCCPVCLQSSCCCRSRC